jgi:Glutaredoxin-like domain (DUF836)
MDQPALILLSTSGCSLCEQALDALFSMPELTGYRLQVVDVVNDESLLLRYGSRLPVLLCGDRELDGRLTVQAIRHWLNG